jgi:hypothetical protein
VFAQDILRFDQGDSKSEDILFELVEAGGFGNA